ncbi:hypothetical protein FQ192_10320 [Pseudomonas sp. ANT_J12]|uniref:hypothetical protein n=1 Tax=Pseudomonas sp. ANT_J12 TaxID=2597351 RepID=UPI0011F2FD99|nr:hypothetical protein [Pseudomonas sp. ANT_J12]KAA0995431.1 hypothetical protein FQ192_10320 [Pseudomonas sp. ANT_J12]
MHKTVALAALCLLASGCATSSIDYKPPTQSRITNTKVVNKPFDQVWDDLVRQLSSDFFVINNIDKNSRLINLSFSTQKPSEYVDCGVTSRRFENARGENSYVYKTADSSVFSLTNKQGNAFNATRNTKLNGRVNIYVAPAATGTSVAVNTKYVVDVAFVATSFDGQPGGREDLSFDFSTKQGFSSEQVTCYATGALESRILEMTE